MCCIYGMVIHPDSPVKTDEAALGLAKGIFARGFVDIEGRGKDASGFFAMHEDKHWQLIKAPIRSASFVYYEEFRKELDKAITHDTTAIIAHARAKTKGSQANNLNNHPIEYKNLVCVHNGSITNDDKVFETLNCERFGEVDSEAIPAAIYEMSEDPNVWTPEAVSSACNLLTGNVASLIMSKDVPDKLLVVRDSNPIELVYFDELGILFLCSEKNFVLNVLSDLRIFRDYFGYKIPSNTLGKLDDGFFATGIAGIIDVGKMAGKNVSDFNEYTDAFRIDIKLGTCVNKSTGKSKWDDEDGWGYGSGYYGAGEHKCHKCDKEVKYQGIHWFDRERYCWECFQLVKEENKKKVDSEKTDTTNKTEPTKDMDNKNMNEEEITAIVPIINNLTRAIMMAQQEKGLGKHWHRDEDTPPPIIQKQFEEEKFGFRGDKDGIGNPKVGNQGIAYEIGYAQGAWQAMWKTAKAFINAGIDIAKQEKES